MATPKRTRSICASPGCAQFVKKFGLCQTHARHLKARDPEAFNRMQSELDAARLASAVAAEIRRSAPPRMKEAKGCLEDGCPNVHFGRGYCQKHYHQRITNPAERLKRAAERAKLPPSRVDSRGRRIPDERTCSVGGCDKRHDAHGYCRVHHYRWKIHGDPLVSFKDGTHRRDVLLACSVDGCEKPYNIKGLCKMHNARMRRYGSTDLPPSKKKCDVDGCDEEIRRPARYCKYHHYRWKRNGDPVLLPERPERVQRRCSIEGCDLVHSGLGFCGPHYGRLKRYGDPLAEKRLMRTKTHCKNGHEFTPENTAIMGKKKPVKVCRICHREHVDRRRAIKWGAGSERIFIDKLLERDAWTCGICLGSIPRGTPYPDALSPSVDHIVALSRGGPHTWDNVQAAHLFCNRSKWAGPSAKNPPPMVDATLRSAS